MYNVLYDNCACVECIDDILMLLQVSLGVDDILMLLQVSLGVAASVPSPMPVGPSPLQAGMLATTITVYF